MIKEIIPREINKFLGSIFYIFITLGILVSFGLVGENLGEHWRIIFGIVPLMELIKLIMFSFFFKYQSPYFIFKVEKDQILCEINLKKHFESIYVEKDVNGVMNEFISIQRK